MSTTNNLPIQPTSFIGREQAMAQLKQLLATTHLLTLTGVGGTGKTRLALQVAADLTQDPKGTLRENPLGLEFPDGVWFVELASLADPALVPQTIASVLGVREEPGRPISATLVDWLRPKHLLLLLDNCEHLIDACAQFADSVLHSAPDVQLLATSREALGITGELSYRVPSLQLPSPDAQLPLSDLLQTEAVKLFVERAVFALPTFTVTDANANAVAQICQRLDGIPLAIELAAARVKVFAVEQIAARLDDRFRLLTGGSRTAVPRQQTLRAAIDWSYSLLSEAERVLLCRLSVFAGGWTFEAAEAVCADVGQDSILSYSVLDVLTQLVNKSLVVADTREGEVRYRLLETIRQYAREKLLDAGEGEQVRERHLAFFVQLAETAEPKLNGPEQLHWLNRLELEHDNIRTALDWSLHSADVLAGMRLTGALERFWIGHGHQNEGLERLAAVLSRVDAKGKTGERVKALMGAGSLARQQSNIALMRLYGEEGLVISQTLGDQRRMAHALRLLGLVDRLQGNYAAAQTRYQESMTISQALGDEREMAISAIHLAAIAESQNDWITARSWYEKALTIWRERGDLLQTSWALFLLGNLAWIEGDYEMAKRLGEESLALRRTAGADREVGMSLQLLAKVTLQQGNPIRAETLAKEGFALIRGRDNQNNLFVSAYMVTLASVRAAQGYHALAVRLCGTVQAFLDKQGIRHNRISDQREQEQTLAISRTQLSETDFNAAWEAGRKLTLEQAIELALQTPTELPTSNLQTPTPKQDFGGLTTREREVAALVGQGMSNREIAEKLVVGERTIETHVSNIFNKLGFTARAEVRKWAKEKGLK